MLWLKTWQLLVPDAQQWVLLTGWGHGGNSGPALTLCTRIFRGWLLFSYGQYINHTTAVLAKQNSHGRKLGDFRSSL